MTRRTLPIIVTTLLLATLIVAGIASATPPVRQQRATLPPTWTPTFTDTVTQRPSATATPTITPTIPADVLCAENFFVDPVEEGRSFRYTADILILAGSELSNTLLSVELVHRLSGETWAGQFRQPGYIAYVLPVTRLPRTGLYDWEISLLDANRQAICSAQGYFFVQQPPPQEPTATADGDAPDVIVVTATPEATQTPVILVVTATPEQPNVVIVTAALDITATPSDEAPAPSIRQQSANTSTPEAIPATAITPDS